MTYEINSQIPTSCTTDNEELFDKVAGERRVSNVKVGGEPIDPKKTYTVAGIDYPLLNNGDGQTAFDGAKDALLRLEYTGDIGCAFINGRMISDNFANGAAWEIGLKEFSAQLKDDCITICIVPLKEGSTVHADSPMAARSEESATSIAELKSVTLQSVYEIKLGL
jgi:hypothetical protein